MAHPGSLAGNIPAAAVTAWRVHDSGPDLWRLIFPVQALALDGYPVTVVDGRERDAYRRLDTQAVLLSRPTADTPAWFDIVRDARLVVLADFDDDVFSDDYYPQWARFVGGDTSAAAFEADRARRAACLARVHGATVTSPALAVRVASAVNGPVEVVPNAIPWDAWQAACARGAPPPGDGLLVGWLGGSRDDADIRPMLEGWAAVAAEQPAVRFVVAGGDAAPALVRALIPPDRLVVLPWLPIDLYPRLFAGLTVGCCALADTPWNRHKSACKAYEYAAAGAAVIASRPVYRRELRPGIDALLADTAAEWAAALTRLLGDAPYRASLAASWGRRVRERHSLETQRHRWAEAWTRLTRRQLAGQSRRGPRW